MLESKLKNFNLMDQAEGLVKQEVDQLIVMNLVF